MRTNDSNSLRNIINIDFNNTLTNIAIPRVSGTSGNSKVREYIIKSMKELGWTVSLDMFVDITPRGRKSFANIIATNNDKICKRRVIACHYDSKYFPSFPFIGATDSAVPCALIIHLVRKLHKQFDSHRSLNKELTIEFIFFDGEESFNDWTAMDSLYGSRHLANKWQNTRSKCPKMNNDLNGIDIMILLDLIGAKNMAFRNYFFNSKGFYATLMSIEKKYNNNKNQLFPSNGLSLDVIDDDHRPFLLKGVPVLHLISQPFPSVWHTKQDDIKHLDFSIINLFANIFNDFLLYLQY
ncbi:glutaminyl-peptide cyclotransferase-like [Oppia nitens]|uniref:glutaminyl-peptide cyclotransferase-like n=1 Tax=Oppia nitens TaxID=1686743 RepID=UPI0023DB547B|nr:glutaminyl-peptide cyclotransferase-like [Oppia nitens]